MFDVERFVSDCVDARAADATHKSVAEVMRAALDDPGAVLDALGEPTGPAIEPLYRTDELTILNVVWSPGMYVPPHNHEMWASIGIYSGREDNIFWRRVKDHPEGLIEAAGARAMSAGEVAPLGADIIHSVLNPIERLTGAIHIYGGDFFDAHRSEWDVEDLHERPLDIEVLKARFSN